MAAGGRGGGGGCGTWVHGGCLLGGGPLSL